MARLSKKQIQDLELKAAIATDQELVRPKRIGVFDSQKQLLKVVNIDGSVLPTDEYDTTIHEMFLPLLDRKLRYVSMRGGRASGKSETTAKVLILLAASEPLRILCFREVQNSIKESVYANLQDEIKKLGLSNFFTSTRDEIRGLNGSTFIFKGLSDLTVDNMKSMSGIDIAWGEEAKALTRNSLKAFLPTIRKEGSRVWFTWNPELETDEVYQRYVLQVSDDCADIEVNYLDNPWFNDVLEKMRVTDQNLLTKAEYSNIWEGKILPAASGAIYFEEIQKAFEEGRITTSAKYDPKLKVHTVWDLGWNDSMSIILCQRSLSDLRIIGYIEDNKKTLEYYNKLLRDLPYSNWGDMWLPHDGRHGDFKTGQSTEEIMVAYGWSVKITPSMTIMNGIRAARQMFDRVYFHKDEAAKLIECLKRYKFNKDGKPEHDEYSHGADAFRYVGIVSEQLTNDSVGTWNLAPLTYAVDSFLD